MKALTPGLAAQLTSGVTTLCHCWKLTRHDGTKLGFTDHDHDLTFDGLTFEASGGFTPGSMTASVGLAVDNLDVLGALNSLRLSDTDLANGLFDDADIEIWRVNWQNVADRVLTRKGSLGEVTHGSLGFQAEVRGLAHRLNQPTGRLFQYACDADFGDARCGLAKLSHTYSATVTGVTGNRELDVTGIEGFANDWFARGEGSFISGANAGASFEIKAHTHRNGVVVIELWQASSLDVVAGDTVSMVSGCDKQIVTCRNKFANSLNHRGFPHMPGNDFALSYPTRGAGNDGGSQNA
ncbi:MAG: DUF2163 domain-containing protein [Parvibaculum sp.]